MRKIFKILFSRWLLITLGLFALGLLIWFVGPLIAFASYRPLESTTARIFFIVFVVGIYVAKCIWRFIKAKNLNVNFLNSLVQQEPDKQLNEEGAEEVALLSKRFDEAIALLKKTNFGDRNKKRSWMSLLFRRQYLYELPWYIFIGAPGSGKTTALVNSGLQFPFAEHFGQGVVQGVGGTRNCDWWFTNEAVLLDTAGRYTTQESNKQADNAAWTGFLELLKKYRPQRPINGAIVTISVMDLLQQSPAQREIHANTLRKRIQELYAEFNINFPIYVLVTKVDLLAGFMEFFGEYGRDERAQVWGTSFELNNDQDNFASINFLAEFSKLEARLNSRLIDYLQHERDIQKRALLYTFPQQFTGLKEVLSDVLYQIFLPSRYEKRALLRGVYFTSGTQEGNPIDRVMGGLARSLQLENDLVTQNISGGKSFFITRLIKDIIFSEAELAGTNFRWERKQKLLRWGVFCISILLTISIIAAWAVSYSNNKTYIEDVEASVPAVLEQVSSLPAIQEMNETSLLHVLRSVKALTSAHDLEDDSIPFSWGLGLYQGEKLTAATNSTYQQLLQDAFLPQLVLRIEDLLNNAKANDLEFLYESLKAYLMLNDPRYFDAGALKAFIVLDWERNLPRELIKKQHHELEYHLDNLLSQGQLSSPISPDKELIKYVRQLIIKMPIANRIYNRLKLQSIGDKLGDFTIIKATGPNASLVFTRKSGQSLTNGVPGLFSYEGYHDYFSQASTEATLQLTTENAWVLGLKDSEDNKLIGGVKNDIHVINEVRRLYLDEYAQIWETFINDIQLVQPKSLQESIQLARLLSANDSPLPILLRAVIKEVTLVNIDESEKNVVDKAKDKVQTVRDKLESLLGRTSEEVPTVRTLSGPESIVDNRFKELRSMIYPLVPGQPAPIDDLLLNINELYLMFSATETALKSGMTPPDSDVPVKAKASARRMPEPVRSMLINLSTGGISQALGRERDKLNQSLKVNLTEFCHKAISGRYPFSKQSKRDVTQDDFARLFSSGGLFDDFFQKNLSQYVDRSVQPWRFRKVGDASMGNATQGLQEFYRAQIIRNVFFQNTERVADIKFIFKPIDMDALITQFILDVDGQMVKYSHGPQVPVVIQWPGPKGSSQVRLQIFPVSTESGGTFGQVYEGPWALFRMFDKVKITPSNQPEKFLVTFVIDGRKAKFEVVTSSVQNPFILRELELFNCPAKL